MGVTGDCPLLALVSTGRCEALNTSGVQNARGVRCARLCWVTPKMLVYAQVASLKIAS